MDRMSSSKSPKVLGLVNMIPATSSSSTERERLDVDTAAASLGTVTTSKPPKVTDAGLVPWAESGMIDLVPDVSPGLVPGAHEEESRELAGCTGGGLQCGGGHPGDLAQRDFELDQELEPALGAVGGGGGMDVGQAGQHGDGVTDLGVVLHRARAQWVGTEIDRELAVAQAGEMADEVAFRDLGECHRGCPAVHLGDDLFDGGLGDTRGAQLPGPASGH